MPHVLFAASSCLGSQCARLNFLVDSDILAAWRDPKRIPNPEHVGQQYGSPNISPWLMSWSFS